MRLLIVIGNPLDWKLILYSPDIQSKEHSMNLQPNILATSQYLEDAKERDDVILIDNRERLNFLNSIFQVQLACHIGHLQVKTKFYAQKMT